MANCSKLLTNYDEQTRLDGDKIDRLRGKRDELKDIIKKWFSENDKYAPDFKGQGSFTMKTIINPKEDDELYDIDYGVYINKLDLEKDGDDFINANTAQGWVKSAVEKHIEDVGDDSFIQKVEHKNKCIRVYYKAEKCEDKFHVDLPVYYKSESDICYLAVKNNSTNEDNGWEESDPRAIVEWFLGEINKKDERLRRIVRYLKNWTALQSWDTTKPSGLVWTVLSSDNFDNSELDDISLLETAKKIKTFLKPFSGKPKLSNPINESEDLLEKYSSVAIDAIADKIQKLVDKATLAIQLTEEEQEDAEAIWQKIFTDLSIDSSSSDASGRLETKSEAVLGKSERSA